MIIDYTPEHLLSIQWQREQGGYGTTRAHAEGVACGWRQKTALQDGIVVACAGILPIWEGRAMAWAAIDYRIRRATFLEMHRAMLAALDVAPFKRLEMYVKPDFPEAWRWAQRLGFTCESRMQAGAPDGKDLWVFTRIRGRAVREKLAR